MTAGDIVQWHSALPGEHQVVSSIPGTKRDEGLPAMDRLILSLLCLFFRLLHQTEIRNAYFTTVLF